MEKYDKKDLPYNLYTAHDSKTPKFLKEENEIIITSVDPSIVNCNIYVFGYNLDTKEERSIHIQRFNFKKDKTTGPFGSSVKQLNGVEKKFNFFSRSHYIVIGAQKKISLTNTRMDQHLISYFLTNFVNRGAQPNIIEISGKYMIESMMCPYKKKRDYRRWCIPEAIKMLKERKEPKYERAIISRLENPKNGDNMGDVICQGKVFLSVLMSEKSPPFPVRRGCAANGGDIKIDDESEDDSETESESDDIEDDEEF
jgi:hypothetical protein